jgi:hypothetical protein
MQFALNIAEADPALRLTAVDVNPAHCASRECGQMPGVEILLFPRDALRLQGRWRRSI